MGGRGREQRVGGRCSTDHVVRYGCVFSTLALRITGNLFLIVLYARGTKPADLLLTNHRCSPNGIHGGCKI